MRNDFDDKHDLWGVWSGQHGATLVQAGFEGPERILQVVTKGCLKKQ